MYSVTSEYNCSDSAYSLPQFAKEWEGLAAKITALSDKISATSTGRLQFEGQLDEINFEQMSLADRVKTLSPKDLETAKPMMESMEKALTILDSALYKPTLNSSKELANSLMSTFYMGVISGAIGYAVGQAFSSLTAPSPQPASQPLDGGTGLAMSRCPGGLDIEINIEININNGNGGSAGSGSSGSSGTSGGTTGGTESNGGQSRSLFFA